MVSYFTGEKYFCALTNLNDWILCVKADTRNSIQGVEKPLERTGVCLTPALGTLWRWEPGEAVASRNIGCSHTCDLRLAVLGRGPVSSQQRDFQEKGTPDRRLGGSLGSISRL